MAGRPADLAGASDDRPHGPAVGWSGPGWHVLLDGYPIKTLPSRLDASDLARLRATVPPGRVAAAASGFRRDIEVERTVNARAISASAITSSVPDHRWPGNTSRCGWTGRSRTSSPTAPWSAPSPARSRSPPGTGCAEPAPEPPGQHNCPPR